mgnify:CR=1 FL=1
MARPNNNLFYYAFVLYVMAFVSFDSFLDGFLVISKRKLKSNNQDNYERLQKSLSKVKEWEKENRKPKNDITSER